MTSVGNLTKQYVIVRGLMSNEQYIITMEYTAVMGAFLCFIGGISNIVIIRTFIAMGVRDGVTVSFLALAIFDLTYLIAGVCLGIIVMFYVTELKSFIRFPIQPSGMSIYFTNIMILISVTNVLATTFLAIARSMCVARPLQFKNTFTRGRAIMVMYGFVVFAISIYMPIFANMGMSNKFDKLTNTSRPSWWGSAIREQVKDIVWVVTELVLSVATQAITIVCVVIMVNSLRAASRFRQASASVQGHDLDSRRKIQDSKHNSGMVYSDTGSVAMDRLTGKDVKVVQQVVLICVVYIVCNVPKLAISLITFIEPEFAIGKRYMNLYMSTNGLRKHIEIVNSAVNLIIYYKYNTKFRSVLLGRDK